jgi:hypothetical protein
MVQYVTYVGLTYNQVRVWFKERRRKERREMETIGAHIGKATQFKIEWAYQYFLL